MWQIKPRQKKPTPLYIFITFNKYNFHVKWVCWKEYSPFDVVGVQSIECNSLYWWSQNYRRYNKWTKSRRRKSIQAYLGNPLISEATIGYPRKSDEVYAYFQDESKIDLINMSVLQQALCICVDISYTRKGFNYFRCDSYFCLMKFYFFLLKNLLSCSDWKLVRFYKLLSSLLLLL